MNNYGFLGIVQGGRLNLVVAEDNSEGSFRLASSPVIGTDSPEASEIPLQPHEGKALLVRGIARNGWIYAASIVEEASLILTAVAWAALRGTRSREVKQLLFLGG